MGYCVFTTIRFFAPLAIRDAACPDSCAVVSHRVYCMILQATAGGIEIG
ncbi:MAG: hypothetical protein ACT6FG_07470 [Methanosarcinaceae archaeon]